MGSYRTHIFLGSLNLETYRISGYKTVTGEGKKIGNLIVNILFIKFYQLFHHYRDLLCDFSVKVSCQVAWYNLRGWFLNKVYWGMSLIRVLTVVKTLCLPECRSIWTGRKSKGCSHHWVPVHSSLLPQLVGFWSATCTFLYHLHV